MLGAFRAAASGMVAQQQLIDVVSNNLANLNTPGFRASQARFHDLMYERAPVCGELLANAGEAPASPGSSPALQDLVQTGDGGAAYTRDGSFSRDALGRLVTSGGQIVLPETRIPADARDIRVDS